MDHGVIGNVLGVIFVALWCVVAFLCFSRIHPLLDDRHHLLASPLVPVKVCIVTLLGLEAIAYAAMGELELFFPDAPWRLMPAYVFHITVQLFLRPAAVVLFCIVVSTPAALYGCARRTAPHTHAQRDVTATPVAVAAAAPVNGSAAFRSSFLCREGTRGIDDHDDDGYSVMDCGGRGDYTRSGAEERCCTSVTDVADVQLMYTVPGEDDEDEECRAPVAMTPRNGPHRSGVRSPLQLDFLTRKIVEGDDSESQIARQKLMIWEDNLTIVDRNLDENERHHSSGSTVPGMSQPQLMTTMECWEISAVTSGYSWKDRCVQCGSTLFRWVFGRPPPEDLADEHESLVERWSRQLLWRVALRLRLFILLWVFFFLLSIVFVECALKEELRSCHERTSELAVCRSIGLGGAAPRLHLPRTLSILVLINNALLLLFWAMCGAECLSRIGNVLTKQSFLRTYLIGALLLAALTMYECLQLFDALRYNGLVTVVIVSLKNVCDGFLVLLLALRLGTASRRMPQWYTLLGSLFLRPTASAWLCERRRN
ncbi:hypothetical protein DQ04_06861030 [Trypanosoma grayi]|uniref:hypothetical protein n=1 Tax=Trypanosoma grayi TaxID=71804 RepID=UPI0004F43527|nr:hypothetical protein DQ04_06861030 [Trypanosoma grayi]KEG08587.1 hypothetical protein DQ04_06861030 [Trypanosoma grayi]